MEINRERLKKYEGNLIKVTQLLKATPDDKVLVNLRNTILEGIEITKSLIEKEEKPKKRKERSASILSDNNDDYDGVKADIKNTIKDINLIDDEKLKKLANKNPTFIKSLLVGSRVLLEDKEDKTKMQPSVIETIYKDEDTGELVFELRIFISNEQVTVQESSGRINPLKPKKGSILNNLGIIKLGLIVLGKYSIDNEWYRGKLVEISKDSAVIQYLDYGTKERLPFEYLVVINNLEESITSDTKQNIPDNLRLFPTDSDFTKQMKRKKLKFLRKKSKDAVADQISEKRRQGWQSFQKKKKVKKTVKRW